MKNPNYKVDDTGVEFFSNGTLGYPLLPIPSEQQQNPQVLQSALIFRDACQSTPLPAPSDDLVHRIFLETYRHRKVCKKDDTSFPKWQREELKAAIQSICTGQDVRCVRERYNHILPAPPAPKKRGAK